MRLNKCFLKRVRMVCYSFTNKRTYIILDDYTEGKRVYVSYKNAQRILLRTNGIYEDFSKY
jgi:hypothetical protein